MLVLAVKVSTIESNLTLLVINNKLAPNKAIGQYVLIFKFLTLIVGKYKIELMIKTIVVIIMINN